MPIFAGEPAWFVRFFRFPKHVVHTVRFKSLVGKRHTLQSRFPGRGLRYPLGRGELCFEEHVPLGPCVFQKVRAGVLVCGGLSWCPYGVLVLVAVVVVVRFHVVVLIMGLGFRVLGFRV